MPHVSPIGMVLPSRPRGVYAQGLSNELQYTCPTTSVALRAQRGDGEGITLLHSARFDLTGELSMKRTARGIIIQRQGSESLVFRRIAKSKVESIPGFYVSRRRDWKG